MANISISELLCVMLFLSSSSSVDSKKNSNLGTERSRFDLALFCNISRINPFNFVISPISLKFALLMISEGATGNSAGEIKWALHYGAANLSNRDNSSDDVVKYRKAKKRKVIFKLANRIFMANNYTVNPNYFDRLKKLYLADVSLVDMKKPNETAVYINDWVKKKTKGNIPIIVREFAVKDESALFVANAAYFRGVWQYKFQENLNFRKCFYHHGGAYCKYTTMMMNVGRYKYGNLTMNGLDARAIQLFYKDHKHFMLILLPLKRDGIDEVIEKLRSIRISDIVARLKRHRVLLEMPKFNITYYSGMASALKDLNIQEIFSPQAHLTDMAAKTHPIQNVTDNGVKEATLRVNDILHAAKISVFEKGVKGGSATGEGVLVKRPPDYEEFIVEHPFAFIVMEQSTGSILFAGKVMEPK